jgi:hypothetical protein
MALTAGAVPPVAGRRRPPRAVVLLADSGLRLLMAYTLPVPVVPALETTLSVVTIVLLQLPTHLLLRRAGAWQALFGRRPVRSPTIEEEHVR